jgi:hypothetical protein
VARATFGGQDFRGATVEPGEVPAVHRGRLGLRAEVVEVAHLPEAAPDELSGRYLASTLVTSPVRIFSRNASTSRFTTGARM